jgi:hypothetical protein
MTRALNTAANVFIGNRVRIHEGVPLRGAHECERTGRIRGIFPEAWGVSVTVKLDPSGKVGGPFRPGEYTVIS